MAGGIKQRLIQCGFLLCHCLLPSFLFQDLLSPLHSVSSPSPQRWLPAWVSAQLNDRFPCLGRTTPHIFPKNI